MFSERETCIQMLQSTDRKLKTHYYYDKNYIIIREENCKLLKQIAILLDTTFDKPYKLLVKPIEDSRSYFDNLLNQIDFCVLPKICKRRIYSRVCYHQHHFKDKKFLHC